LAVVFFFFAGDGDGDALAVAAPVVEVAVVPCCVQETIKAAPIRAVINVTIDLFIVRLGSTAAECSVVSQMASIKQHAKETNLKAARR
jgi:hypothetical protein